MPNPTRLSLHRDERGLTTVEYIIILGLIAIFGIIAWRDFGTIVARESGEATKELQVVGAAAATGTGAGGSGAGAATGSR